MKVYIVTFTYTDNAYSDEAANTSISAVFENEQDAQNYIMSFNDSYAITDNRKLMPSCTKDVIYKVDRDDDVLEQYRLQCWDVK